MLKKLALVVFVLYLSLTAAYGEMVRIQTRNGEFISPMSQLTKVPSLIKTQLETKLGTLKKDEKEMIPIFVDVNARTMQLVLHYFSRGLDPITLNALPELDLLFLKADLDFLQLEELSRLVQLQQTKYTCHAFCSNQSQGTKFYVHASAPTLDQGFEALEKLCGTPSPNTNRALMYFENDRRHVSLREACWKSVAE